jgi:hypothetical protein
MEENVRSIEEAESHIRTLSRKIDEIKLQLSQHEQELDTFVRTPAWKRWLFIIDGWSGHAVVDRPNWRPWRKWWTF